MKFIVLFLFSIFLISPVYADFTQDCDQYTSYGLETCKNKPGCYYDYNTCLQCTSGTYSPIGQNSCSQCDPLDEDYQSILADQTKSHPAGASSCSDFICSSGYIPSGNHCIQITPADCGLSPADWYTFPNGATSCNDWICTVGHYADSGHSTCSSCPHGATTAGDGATSINQCYCPSNTYQYPNANNWTHCVTYTGHLNSTSTGCATGASATTPSGSGDNWTVTCTCDSHASNQNGQCVCPTNYATTTDNNGVVHCAPCGTGEITQNGNCICNERYYGSHADGCTPCPSGTKVATLGTTTTNADCRAHSDTKFCDANGQNCMKLLQ